LFCSSPPVTHSRPRSIEIASRYLLALIVIADAAHRNDSAILHEKPQHTGIKLADVAQFKQTIAERLG
jgi:hypothetical protein